MNSSTTPCWYDSVHDHGGPMGSRTARAPPRDEAPRHRDRASLVVTKPAPVATTSVVPTGVTGTGATLNGTVNVEGEILEHGFTHCDSTSNTIGNCTGTVTTVNGSTTPLTGRTTTAETATLSGLTPQHYLLLQHQGGQQRWYLLWNANRASITSVLPLGDDRSRGQRDHGHRLDPQRLGQRGELIDHGELLLQHDEPHQLLGRYDRGGEPAHGHGHLEIL